MARHPARGLLRAPDLPGSTGGRSHCGRWLRDPTFDLEQEKRPPCVLKLAIASAWALEEESAIHYQQSTGISVLYSCKRRLSHRVNTFLQPNLGAREPEQCTHKVAHL